MPIYEYRCEACGHTLDWLQKVSDAPLTDCPSCEEPRLRRLISAPSFRLKGGGWYETDFKSDKERRRNLVESGDKSESGDKGGTKKESGDKESKKAETTSGDSKSGDSKSETKKPAADSKSKSKSSGTEAA